MKARVLFVGGGSGGHFYPLMAIAEHLRKLEREPGSTLIDLYYIGPSEYSSSELQKYSIKYKWCPSGKRRKYFSFQNIIDYFKSVFGIFVAIFHLFVLYPDVVVSKGSATSVPVVFAAWLLRIPIIIHESDAVPGAANRFAERFARYIAIAYHDTADHFKSDSVALVGIPMRTSVLSGGSMQQLTEIGINDSLPLILVLGGSQGAERVNTLVLDTLDELLPKYQLLHQTGVNNIDVVSITAKSKISDSSLIGRYHPIGFLDATTLHSALGAAAIVLSRAGSTSIHEIAAHGTPSILMPIPEDISHDQRTNAYTYARTGAASVIEEHNFRDGLLSAEIQRIMSDRNIYDAMAEAARMFAITDASEKITTLIHEIINEH